MENNAAQVREDFRIRSLLDRAYRHMFDANIIMDGHFQFDQYRHGSVYVNPHKLFSEPSLSWRLVQDLVEYIPSHILDSADAIAGPVMGGALIAHQMAGIISARRNITDKPIGFVAINKDAVSNSGYILQPFYQEKVSGKKVILVDDVVHTGQTTEICMYELQEAGAHVITLAYFIDRGSARFRKCASIRKFSLTTLTGSEIHHKSVCPQCRSGVPITKF